MAKHGRKKVSKTAVVGSALATALGIGFAPTLANAAVYAVGVPDWVPTDGFGDAVNILPADPNAVIRAIQNDRAKAAPIVGWGVHEGFSEQQLRPAWVTWINPNPGPIQVNGHRDGQRQEYQCIVFLCGWVEIPQYTGTVTGMNWTVGQWVSPSSPEDVDPGVYLLYLATGGDPALALAPLVNWTAYLSDSHFIGYGDGAIAVGTGYQNFIDLARSGELEPGPALTGPRKIVITDPNDPVTKDVTKAFVKIDEVEYLVLQNAPGLWFAVQPLNPDDFPEAPDLPKLEITPAGVIDVTFLTVHLLRNPGRPNGGLYARFAPAYQELNGVNPVTPERQDVLPPELEGVSLNLADLQLDGLDSGSLEGLAALAEALNGKPAVVTLLKTDTTWQYDILSDAAVTPNPIAWANSAAAALLPLTLGASLLTDPSSLGVTTYTAPDGTVYITVTQDQLPLLAAPRLIAGLLGAATAEEINTPVADALEPVLRLLVNTSYTDVVRNEDGTWTRTLNQMHEPTLFGTRPLTRSQAALLAGDIIAELGRGIGDEYTDVANRIVTRTVNFLRDSGIDVPADLIAAAERLAVEPGKAIKTVSRQLGDGTSKVLGVLDANLPDGPPAPTQEQLADGQRVVGTALKPVKDQADAATAQVNGAIESFTESEPGQALTKTGTRLQNRLNKRVTKTQNSIDKALDRTNKVVTKLGSGDVKGAVKQAGDNAKYRVDRLKKDINNGINKITGTKKQSDSGSGGGSGSGGSSDGGGSSGGGTG